MFEKEEIKSVINISIVILVLLLNKIGFTIVFLYFLFYFLLFLRWKPVCDG